MIRYFNLNDADAIYKSGEKITKNFSKTNNLEEIYESPYVKILVYEVDEKIVGFLMYTELEETVDILDIIVEEAYRKKKIASCLLDYMITSVASSVKLATLEVRKSNDAAIDLYKKFGFSIINVRKEYYDTEDAYLMGRKV